MYYSDKSIKLTWFTHLILGKQADSNINRDNLFFTEKVPIESSNSITNNNCLIYGAHLFNFLNIRDISDVDDKYITSLKRFNYHFRNYIEESLLPPEFRLLINSDEKERPTSDFQYISLFYDVLSFLSFNSTFRILSFINKFRNEILNNDFDSLNKNLISYSDIFHDKILSFDSLQEQINRCCKKINTLLIRASYKHHFSTQYSKIFFDEIFEEITKIKHKLIKPYLKSKGRCFAVFIDNENKNKYITFSGLLDVEDNKIITKLNLGINPQFIHILKHLAHKSNSILIQSSLNISRYILISSNKKPYMEYQVFKTFDEALSTDSIENIKQKYSCCERKIFAYFANKTPSGTLHIKFQPCSECYMGIAFQIKNGAVLKWEYSL